MLQIKEIQNKKEWEEFLTKKYQGRYPFFQGWNWGEVQKKLGFPIIRFGLFAGKELIGVTQSIEVKAKRGHYLYLRHGIILLTYTAAEFTFFLDYIKQFAKAQHAEFIRISRFPKQDAISETFFKTVGFSRAAIQTIDAEVCWVLDITVSEEELLKNMRKSHRYLIKKAPTYGIEVIKSTSMQDLDLFLPLYQDLSKRKHFVAHRGLSEEFDIFAKDGEALLLLAKYDGKIIAGALIDFVGESAIYRHGTSDDAYRTIPASYLLQWEAIKEAQKRGKSIYNFWGIAPPTAVNHPWKGITLFKTGFGGTYEYFLPTMDLPLHLNYLKNYLVDWISAKKKK